MILEAAVELFKKNGYHKTSVLDISKDANVGVGSVYNVFKSKEVLYQECLYLVVQQNINEIIENCTRLNTLEEKLECIARLRFEHWQRHRVSLFDLMTNTPMVVQKIRSAIVQPLADLQDYIEEILKNAEGRECAFKIKDYKYLSMLFTSMLDSFLYGWIHAKIAMDKIYLERVKDLVDFFLHGVAEKEAKG